MRVTTAPAATIDRGGILGPRQQQSARGDQGVVAESDRAGVLDHALHVDRVGLHDRSEARDRGVVTELDEVTRVDEMHRADERVAPHEQLRPPTLETWEVAGASSDRVDPDEHEDHGPLSEPDLLQPAHRDEVADPGALTHDEVVDVDDRVADARARSKSVAEQAGVHEAAQRAGECSCGHSQQGADLAVPDHDATPTESQG